MIYNRDSMRRIIIDIDNTLWYFAPVLYERMKRVNPHTAPMSEWRSFDFWKEYISPRTFYEIIKGIHMDQEQFVPFPDARPFLASLKALGLHITIASHREKGTLGATVNWLNNNRLIFDDVHLSNDKSVLFDECQAIVDDSPFVLDKAARAGIIGSGLRMPWNDKGGYTLFDTLPEVLCYLRGQV